MLLDKYDNIDFNKPQIDLNQDNKLMTPIASYIKRCYSKIDLQCQPLETDHFKSFFGKQPFKIALPIEYFELLNLIFEKDRKEIAIHFLKLLVHEPIDNILLKTDEDQNNLMHVTEAAFSDKEFQQFFSDKKFET